MAAGSPQVIRTPDQRLRVFVSSTLVELAPERAAVRSAVEQLRLVPVMFELGARPYPPRALYRAYVDQSQVFVGVYWQSYGWVAPGEDVSGLEDEYRCADGRPRLIYIKEPSPDREDALSRFLAEVKSDDTTSYKRFSTDAELAELVQQDLAVLLSERFDAADAHQPSASRPPLRANLPAPLTSLVGRGDAVERVGDLVVSGTRLLTLTGPGGVGKSRLASAVARHVEPRLPDGAAFVTLATIEDPQFVLPAIAAQLGVRLDGGQPAADALVDHLAGRRMALVLDNLEQVASAAPALIDLLVRLPDLRVLATSRTPLHVAGEQVWPLEPLELPPSDTDAAAIGSASAVELFVQRARAADPGFVLDDRNAEEVAELCRRLDGLPLAIELAAARVRLFPPATILERLGPRLDLLTGGPDRPERHRTLAATIDWSIHLLDPAERSLFARLCVFHGGATLDAIEYVCDVDGTGGIADGIETLLDHGLVRVVGVDDGAPRLGMLATVRADATTRLDECGETDALRRRHLAWFAELADRAQPFLCGPGQLEWLRRIDPERANLRAAAAAGFDLGEPAVVLEMAWDLYVYYQLRGAYHEPATWVRRVAQDQRGLDARQRAVVTTALSIAALSTGTADVEVEATALQEALSAFEREGATFEEAVAHMHLGVCALARSDWQRARDAEQAASDRFAQVGHDWGVGSSQNLLGVALGALGDADHARAALEQALAAGRRIANETIVSQARTLLAALALDRDEQALAQEHLADAARLVDASRDAIGASGCLEVLAALALRQGDVVSAHVALDVAAETRRRIGSPLNVVLRGRVDRLRQAVIATSGPDGPRRGESPPAGDEDGTTDVFDVLRRVGATVTARPEPVA